MGKTQKDLLEQANKEIKAINNRLNAITEQKDNYKKNYYIKVITVFVVLSLLISLFAYVVFMDRKANSFIAVDGDPQDIKMSNYNGEIGFNTFGFINIGGKIRNRERLFFSYDGEEYIAEPNELLIEFECDDKKSNIFLFNRPVYYSTNVSSDIDIKCDQIEIKKANEVLNYSIKEIGQRHDDNHDTITIKIKDAVFDGFIQLQEGSIINFSGAKTVTYKGSVFSENANSFTINKPCGFLMNEVKNCEITLGRDGDGCALSGTIDKFEGNLCGNDAKLYCTTRTAQNYYYCGNQSIDVRGDELTLEYKYNSDFQDIVMVGKAKEAKLENIDVLEGFLQFCISNYNAIFGVVLATLFGIILDRMILRDD